jgi:hypothetical protein
MFKELEVLKIIYTEISEMSKDKKAQPIIIGRAFLKRWVNRKGLVVLDYELTSAAIS